MNAIDYIPHQKPMVFIDTVTTVTENSIEASLEITSELMFVQEEGLPTWVSIEIMAQTISAYAGFQGSKSERAPRIGYLLGTRRMVLPMAYFALGKTLKIHAQREYSHEGLGQFLCEIEYEDHKISALLSVYEPEEGMS
ncbi:ApeP family dehydratase [Acinetobacter rathckeae]|uniref:ApeP family dehydratase n=1 Tax=Acinetobacter rathckeae TaxID=2605272 RepID=UPI0018A2E7BA|nr:3-hydroxylacyl-ACP dehydratase [Acinetobacter rathckeae]MBF7695964.1 3-hydroxylacyl-ACP dehydratase [Acinetobacter rathckeae]